LLVTAKISEYKQSGTEVRSARSTRKSGSVKTRLYIMGVIITIFVFGVYYTSLSAQIASKGYQLEQLEKEITQLQTSNERTELIVSSMSSLDKVEHMAVETLGMNKPDSAATMIVAEAGLGDSEESAGGMDTLQAEENGSVFSAETIYSAFASFFEIRKAEASPGTR